MSKCFKCGVSGEEVRLLDAVGTGGLVLVCEDCAEKEEIPVLKRPTTFQLKNSENSEYRPFRERRYKELGRPMPPSEKQIKTNRVESRSSSKTPELTLKDILDRNMKKKHGVDTNVKKEIRRPINLLENYHWIVMNARRKKHLTPSQVGEAIGESESVVRMVERGMLPDDDYRILSKLEKFFDIRLTKEGKNLEAGLLNLEKEKPARILSFDSEAARNLTISDLKEIKRQKDLAKKERDVNLDRDMNMRGSLDLEEKGILDSSGRMAFNLGERPKKVGSQAEFDKLVEEEIVREVKENLKKEEGLNDKDISKMIWGKK